MRQLHVDSTYLASTHVGTPDPRKANPPLGQKLIIDWTVPPELLTQDPKILLTLIYKNHTQEERTYAISARSGTEVYSLLNKEFEEREGLLTYRAEIVAGGEVYKEWKHQLWVNLLTFEEETTASAASTSSSVVSQPMQGSVMETAYLREEGFSSKN